MPEEQHFHFEGYRLESYGTSALARHASHPPDHQSLYRVVRIPWSSEPAAGDEEQSLPLRGVYDE